MYHNLDQILGHMIGLFWNVPILGPNSVAYFELFHFSFQMAKNQYLIWRLKSTAHDTIKYWLMFRIFKSHFSPFMFFIKRNEGMTSDNAPKWLEWNMSHSIVEPCVIITQDLRCSSDYLINRETVGQSVMVQWYLSRWRRIFLKWTGGIAFF